MSEIDGEIDGEIDSDTDGDTDYVALMPFATALGMRIDSAAPDEVTGSLDWSPERTTAGGAMHGGALMAFADSVGAVCAHLNLPGGASTSTISSSTVFLRGVREGTVRGIARPLHVGRSTIALVTELRDAAGRLVGQVTQTQSVLRP